MAASSNTIPEIDLSSRMIIKLRNANNF